MTSRNRRPSRSRAALVAAAAVPCLILLALAAGCTIEDPALPTFSTRLAVPVGTHDLTVTEIVAEQNYLYTGEDSVLFFNVEGDTTSVALDLDLSVDLDAVETDADIGSVTLDDPAPLEHDFALVELLPAFGSLPPGVYPVPAFTFEVESGPLGIDDIDHAHVDTGVITLTLRNDLPIPISGDAPPEILGAEVLHPVTGAVITALVFAAEIAPGAEATAVADLADTDLPGSLVVRLSGGSAGAGGAPIGPGAALGVTLAIGDLVVDEARAIIGAQSFQEIGAVALPDSFGILEATVASGLLDVTLTSELPVAATAYIHFNDFVTADGSPYLLAFEMPRNGIEITQADLAGARISSGGGAPARSACWMNISAEMAATTLAIGEVTGLIPAHSLALEPMTQAIDVPDELDGLQLPAATLVIDLFNGTGVRADIDLLLTGRNASGETATLTAAAGIAPSRDEGPARTTILLDETNSNIADLLSILPETFTFTGVVNVGGDGEIGTIRPDDRAQVVWRADAPLRLVIEDAEVDRNPEALDLDEDLRTNIEDHLLAAEILVEIDNHFPFGLDVLFLVGPDSTSALDDPELVIGPLSVTAGAIDETTRYVNASVATQHVIALDAEQVRAFTRPDAFTALRALIPGTDGQEVVLRAGDGLTARGALSLDVLIEDD